MQLVLDTKNIRLSNKNSNFFVESEKSSRIISPGKLSSIAVTATIVLQTDAIQLAIQHKIPILFFGRYGKLTARIWTPRFESISTLRRQQVRFTESTEATAWMIDVFQIKTDGQLYALRYLQNLMPRNTGAISKAMQSIKQQRRQFESYREQLPDQCRKNIMGTEGAIARIYWQAIGNSLPRRFRFQNRSRRPAQDMFNAAINYNYGMLYSIVEGGIFSVGLDPYLGILHSDEYNKPTLSFDLIECFRPWIDQFLIRQCYEEVLQPIHFTKNQHGVFFNKAGKAVLIPAFNQWLRSKRKFLEREATVKNHIYYLAGRLAHRTRNNGE